MTLKEEYPVLAVTFEAQGLSRLLAEVAGYIADACYDEDVTDINLEWLETEQRWQARLLIEDCFEEEEAADATAVYPASGMVQ